MNKDAKGTTPITGCGCCLNPVDDRSEPSDLCSEATGTFDGVGWRIQMCSVHDAAPELLKAAKAMDALMDNLFESVPWGDTFGLDIKALNDAPLALKRAIAKVEDNA